MQNPKPNVLLVGHRQALIRQMAKRLNLHCYLDDEPTDNRNIRQARYAVCLDSISKVDPSKKYDYIIIDESEQVLSHFLSATMEDKRNLAIRLLRQLVGGAKHVIALDADLGWTTFRFFSSCHRFEKVSEDAAIVINEYVEPRGTLRLLGSKPQLIGELHEALAAGERCYVTSNSKSLVDKIYAGLVDKLVRKVS